MGAAWALHEKETCMGAAWALYGRPAACQGIQLAAVKQVCMLTQSPHRRRCCPHPHNWPTPPTPGHHSPEGGSCGHQQPLGLKDIFTTSNYSNTHAQAPTTYAFMLKF
eukprot:365773-Chlamydomonas_euryale.AAC.3